MTTEMMPGTVRMGELLSVQSAIIHGAGMITALHHATEWASHLETVDDEAATAKARRAVYLAANTALEGVFNAMDAALAKVGKPPAEEATAEGATTIAEEIARVVNEPMVNDPPAPPGANVVRIQKRAK